MSTCEPMQAQLNSFLDGELDATHAVALSAHMEECPACRREFQALKATQALLRGATVPDGAQARRQALDSFRRSRPAKRPSSPIFCMPVFSMRRAAPVFAAAAAITLAIVIRQTTISPPLDPTSAMPMIASASGADGLPTPGELDEMTSLHAARSFAVTPGDGGVQQTTLADANSRLPGRKP